MSTRTDPANHMIDLEQVGHVMRKLHDQVCQEKRRVEITRDDCDDVCIMISRKELESLEQAMAIFADTAAFEDMCQHLKKLLNTAGVVYGGAVDADA